MSIFFTSKDNNMVCFTDHISSYMTFHSNSPAKTEGVVRKNKTLIYDFCILKNNTKKKKIIETRYKNCITTVFLSYFEILFKNCGVQVKISLLNNALYFEIKNNDQSENYLVLLCSNTFAKLLDAEKNILKEKDITISKPCKSIKTKLFKEFKEKATYSRIVKSKGSFYLSLELSSNKAKNHLKKLFSDDFFKKNCNLIKKLTEQTILTTGFTTYDQSLIYSAAAGFQFIVKNKEYNLWAGLPWFRNFWSRDTFISFSGILLCSGNFSIAKNILRNFASIQDKNPHSITYGRVPNLYSNDSDKIYNTADGTLWFLREIFEYAQYTGDKGILEELWNTIYLAIEADRTIRTDTSGFLKHGDADTWMDARIFNEQSWSNRGNRANEIQALWYTVLLCGASIAELLEKHDIAKTWRQLAAQIKRFFTISFFNGKQLADCIMKDNTPDYRCRPNQLMVITIPLITDAPLISNNTASTIVENTVSELLFPYGICSLSQNDPYFHPWHKAPDFYYKDAAYHNGTIWEWNIGFTIGALCKTGHKTLAWKLAQNISDQILHTEAVGTLSELVSAYTDIKGNIIPSGTYSQAWSVAEFNRAALQYFIGLKPELLNNMITFEPALPEEWKNGSMQMTLDTNTPFILFIKWHTSLSGTERNFSISYKNKLQQKCKEKITIKTIINDSVNFFLLTPEKEININEQLFPERKETLEFAVQNNYSAEWNKPKCLLKKNWLAEIVLHGKFNGDHPDSCSNIK